MLRPVYDLVFIHKSLFVLNYYLCLLVVNFLYLSHSIQYKLFVRDKIIRTYIENNRNFPVPQLTLISYEVLFLSERRKQVSIIACQLKLGTQISFLYLVTLKYPKRSSITIILYYLKKNRCFYFINLFYNFGFESNFSALLALVLKTIIHLVNIGVLTFYKFIRYS